MPTYTAPTTRTTGELISAAIFNTDLVENIKYFKDAPAFAGNVTVGGTLGVTGAITSATSVALTGTTNNLGTITTGVWNAGAVTSSAAVTGTANTVGLVARNAVGNGALVQFKNFASTTRYNFFAGTGYNLSDSFEVIASTAVGGDAISGTTLLAVSQAGLLTVSGFGTNSFSAAGTGEQTLKLQNTTAGVGNYVRFNLSTDIASVGVLDGYSSTYTTANQSVQSGVLLGATAAGGLSIAATHASGAIRFYSGGSTLRGQFSAAGNLLINTTLDSAQLMVSSPGTTKDTVGLINSTNAYTSYFVNFYNYLNVSAGSIQNTSASVVAYTSVSDQRIKRDLGLASDLSGLRALRVHDFEWTTDGILDRNVFAQEAYAAYPGRAVSPGRLPNGDFDTDPDVITKAWTVEKAGYVPDLIVGWQQHDARLAVLEAKLLAAGV